MRIFSDKNDKIPNQERLRQQAIKDQEKERLLFYQKQKEGQKDVRSKYREKVQHTSAHIARSFSSNLSLQINIHCNFNHFHDGWLCKGELNR